MKKLFALVLAVVMICAMSTSVFAAAEHVVGNGKGGTTDNGTHTDGATSVDASSQAELAITANIGATNHRYAIDIEFPTMSFDVAGSNLTWDVNTLEYVTTGATTLENETFDITITNYSDLSVWYKVAVDDKDGGDGVTVVATHATSATLATSGVEVVKAVAATHTATTDKFTISVTSTNWTEVAEYWAGKLSTEGVSSLPMATATVTFSSAAFPTTP